jgi:hypothetical protein
MRGVWRITGVGLTIWRQSLRAWLWSVPAIYGELTGEQAGDGGAWLPTVSRFIRGSEC